MGALSLFVYPQCGKSFLPLQACCDLAGPKLILAPRRALVEQWRARLDLYLQQDAVAEVVVDTYRSARRHIGREWTLLVVDEAHHIPANSAIEIATTLDAKFRMGLSATPVRNDGNEDIIPAVSGYPAGADWPIKESQRPSVTVWIVGDEKAKLALMQDLVNKPVDGKTMVFTFRLAIGKKAARLLRAPFVHAGTDSPLKVIQENDLIVVSSIADEGLSTPVRRIAAKINASRSCHNPDALWRSFARLRLITELS